MHVHHDTEEVFFILRGNQIRLMFEAESDTWETYLKERDLISIPPGVYRGLVNEGIEEALMCVMLGTSKPKKPTYPPDHPMAQVKRP